MFWESKVDMLVIEMTSIENVGKNNLDSHCINDYISLQIVYVIC